MSVSTLPKNKTAKLTPMMEQYMATKEAHPDCLLFYRMGDFYELFFEDAIIAADILNIALTVRGKHLGEDIAMCGVPHHSSDSYLLNLIRSGHRVAICEQMESPAEAKKRGYKAVVRREVVRIVTPGTITEDSLLESSQSNYLAAVTIERKQLSIAWLDISTGEFLCTDTNINNIANDIARISPKELLISDSLYKDPNLRNFIDRYKDILVSHSNSLFSVSRGENRLKEFYEVGSLTSFGNFSKSEIGVLGALIEYVDLTQKGNKPYIDFPKQYKQDHFMVIDSATRKNLEITESLSGNKKACLFSVMNKTVTAAGARLLNNNISNPLYYASAVNERLDMVEFFVNREDLRLNIRNILRSIPDIERAISRITLRRGGPRDLAAISNGLAEVIKIAELLEFAEQPIARGIISCNRKLNPHETLFTKLNRALKKDNLPLITRDGGFISPEYHPKIKELILLQNDASRALTALKEKYQDKTGISSLKVTKNNVIGYYIEVPAAQAKKVDLEYFTHKQSMVNAVRYTTDELQKLEEDIVTASDKVLNMELAIFDNLVEDVIKYADSLSLTAQSLAEIDVMSSLATLALDNNYIRPVIDDSYAFDIKNARHPVVEKNVLGDLSDTFVPNNCELAIGNKLWLLTGPNMAGKSTFLRQNALISIMAQIGSYVPADYAHIGTIDKLFSRIGASDDLARGRSTFMVEMTETATILNQATDKSLVILDEIGRGTATYDGLAIAWSVLEYLHNKIKARGLFATHYHELTTLVEQLKHADSYTVQIREWGDKVIFLHKVIKGAAEKSYGIHVAKLAGLPPNVIKRSNEILQKITDNSFTGHKELPLFADDTTNDNDSYQISEIEEKLSTIDIDNLSPREALDALYELKEML